MRFITFVLSLVILATAAVWTIPSFVTQAASLQGVEPAALTIDYPSQDSIFPPEITPPTFIWHDAASNVTSWRIDVKFADGSPALHFQSKGDAPKIGEIDPRCISSTNELPTLTPEQASSHTWTANDATWAAIKKHSVAGPATVSITGVNESVPNVALSLGEVRITTSKDPLGAPIFYRDVPLMPSQTEKGIIKPLADNAIPLIKWRLRDVSQPASRVVLENMHTCANCHSFSRDGKTMGMDMDGPQNDKGLYALTSVKPETVIRNEEMVDWNPTQDMQFKLNRVAFMSQVSPDGKYVVNTVSGAETTPQNNFYVVNFKDYRFLQVFYPTRGKLAWYSRETKERHLLPGADDPNYVQTDGFWSPDGKTIIFARAEARDPNPPGGKMAARANDPEEVQIHYDLYRIPFNGGKGGTPEPIAGASNNGMSNNFPKVSPDGRWIVFVQNRNGQLMRPDSELYIVPFEGGTARRLQANMSRMNSWHSFSPNGRWLVFSSKARSVYTQMYLTHIDEQGNDSPAILIDNSTAANRAVNIPEFVNIPANGMLKISTPAVDMYNRFDVAAEQVKKGNIEAAILDLEKLAAEYPADARIQNIFGLALAKAGRFDDAIPHYKTGLEINPRYRSMYNNLGVALIAIHRDDEAIEEYRKALEIFPDSDELHDNLGRALAAKGQLDEAATEFQRAIELQPDSADARVNLGLLFLGTGKVNEAMSQFSSAVESNPDSADAHDYLGVALYYGPHKVQDALAQWRQALTIDPNFLSALDDAAHALAASPVASDRDGNQAVKLAEHAVEISKGVDPSYLDTLAMAYAEASRFNDAIETAQHAQQLAITQDNQALANSLARKIELYKSQRPFRDGAPGGQ